MDSENKNEVEREQQASQDHSSPSQQPQLPKDEETKTKNEKLKISLPKFPKLSLPKIKIEGNSFQKLANKLKEYKRVLQITKKPDTEEFKTTVKASALGMTVIGVVGFIIAIIVQLITT